MNGFLTHPLLEAIGVVHGFGTIAAHEPPGLLRPRQVHGTQVVVVEQMPTPTLGDADAVLSTLPGVEVGVVTADCIPVLLADASATVVGAVHAGWRGLAAGVIECALREFSRLGVDAKTLRAVMGPHIGPCCYEVDAPVLDAMRKRFPDWRAAVHLRDTSRPDHAQLDLGLLATQELLHFGLVAKSVAQIPNACTACDPTRFFSYRRDGTGAGRLLHFIAATNKA